MTDIRHIVETTLVPHTVFENAVQRIEQCFTYAEGACEPICFPLIGETRTGKSRTLEECTVRHPTLRTTEGLEVPILRVKTPSKPTVKGLAELMLKAIEDPRWLIGTENAKTLRLKVLMKGAKTRMVMIDEFQHFYDKGSHKIMHHVADWLKILVDDCRIALVVAGLPTCRAILQQNEQLAGRFLAPFAMPRFDWLNDDSRAEFVAILGAFYESLSRHFSLPRLDEPDMAFRCYCGTGGLIGYLTKFLRQAVWNALDAGTQTIVLADLERAQEEAVWSDNGSVPFGNPFVKSFNTAPTTALITEVRKVGTPSQEKPAARGPSARAAKRIRDLRTVLSAS